MPPSTDRYHLCFRQTWLKETCIVGSETGLHHITYKKIKKNQVHPLRDKASCMMLWAFFTGLDSMRPIVAICS